MNLTEKTYEIHAVAQLTGLDPARLRAWERRYGIVRPIRLANGYRAYTADQVELLGALARLVAGGERIGDLAGRAPEEVIVLAAGRELDGGPLAALLAAARSLDRERFEGLVAQQLALLGLRQFAEQVVLPLAQAIGELWAMGKLPVAAEHLASEVVLHALKGGLRVSRGSGALLVAACLPGERHEWGILATLTTLQEDGWRIHYLGADLPVEDVVHVGWKLTPGVMALSGSLPLHVQANLPSLGALPGRLPPGTVAVIGGSGITPYARILRSYGFRIGIEGLRNPTAVGTSVP